MRDRDARQVDRVVTLVSDILRPMLARARAIYLGEEKEHWDGVGVQVRSHVEYVAKASRLSVGEGT